MALMTSRRADEFARLVADGTRTDDPVSAPLLAVVDALTAVPAAPAPRAEFKAALRQRLVAVAAVQAVTPPAESSFARARAASATWRVQRRLVAVGAGAAVVTAVTGVAVGASRSVPGQPFYGVKRGTEALQLATTFGTEDRGKRHLEFARQRLAEVTTLSRNSSSIGSMSAQRALAAHFVTDGNASLIMDTLHDMDVETRAGANDLFVAFRDSGSTEPLHALSRFTTKQYSQLRTLIDSLPPAVQAQAASSLSLLDLVARDTVQLASTSVPPGTNPTGTPTPTAPASSSPGSTPTSTPTSTSTTSVTPHGTPTGPSLPPVPAPSVPSIPPGPVLPTGPLPTAVPSLPDVTGVSGH